MSLLLSRIRLGKPLSVIRCSLVHRFSSSSSLQTPPCSIIRGDPCGEEDVRTLTVWSEVWFSHLDKKVSVELLKENGTIGASHGWVATLKDDGILRLQDDLNPNASETDPKRIPLPPLVTLPHCQTQIVTNVSMSSSSPEDEDCVVAIKFWGPQLSFCRPAQSNSQWTNIRIESPCFYSSPVMFSKKEEMFLIPGSGGHIIGSWDLCKHITKPDLRLLQYKFLPELELDNNTRELMDSCSRTEHLVESRTTGETFLVKWYKKTSEIVDDRIAKMRTKKLMVFKIDGRGNAIYTKDIGDLVIFLSRSSEPFCVPASSFPGMTSNSIRLMDFDEMGIFSVASRHNAGEIGTFPAPYHIPPQDVVAWK